MLISTSIPKLHENDEKINDDAESETEKVSKEENQNTDTTQTKTKNGGGMEVLHGWTLLFYLQRYFDFSLFMQKNCSFVSVNNWPSSFKWNHKKKIWNSYHLNGNNCRFPDGSLHPRHSAFSVCLTIFSLPF